MRLISWIWLVRGLFSLWKDRDSLCSCLWSTQAVSSSSLHGVGNSNFHSSLHCVGTHLSPALSLESKTSLSTGLKFLAPGSPRELFTFSWYLMARITFSFSGTYYALTVCYFYREILIFLESALFLLLSIHPHLVLLVLCQAFLSVHLEACLLVLYPSHAGLSNGS